jgi:catechol 2,3-dioxygenase-like lactoylglutathione lyase family enzyme
MITDIFPTICSDDVPTTRDFYLELFGFEVVFRNEWYVQLQAPTKPFSQLGIVQRDHDSVPLPFQRQPAGVLVAIEVDDVDATHARAQAAGLEMPLDLRSEAWGQRHFMTVDPSGTLVDVITPIPPGPEFADDYVTGANA